MIKLYINGSLKGSSAVGGSVNYAGGKSVYLGATNDQGNTDGFSGKLDNVRFYNRVLDLSEINQLYTVDPYCISSTQVPVASFSISSESCVNQVLRFKDLSTNYPLWYSWQVPGGVTQNPESSIPAFTFSVAGTYTAILTVTNSVGSASSSMVFVVHSKPDVKIVPTSSIVCKNQQKTLIAVGALTYTWSTAAVSATMHFVAISGPYKISVMGTDTNGCVSSDTVKFYASICENAISENNPPATDWKIYPNPNTGEFELDASIHEEAEFVLLDAFGSLIRQGKLYPGDEGKFDLRSFTVGVYYLPVRDKVNSQVIRIIKK